MMDVQDYKFENLGQASLAEENIAADYKFKDLKQHIVLDKKQIAVGLKKERDFAKEKSFKISPIVKEYRGINAQENSEKEKRTEEEVKRRVLVLEKDAYAKGYDEGIAKGREDVYNETRIETEDKLTSLTAMISEVLKTQEDIFINQKQEIYKMIKNLTKWVILRELDNDGEYLGRLLERLVVELQTKSNLLVQLNQKDFEKMPEILDFVEGRLGKLDNIRIESDFDIERNGIIVESSNGIINGTLEEQFKSLDRLFETVGIDE